MPNILFLDLETYSAEPIRNGTYKYAENAEILLFAYAWNGEPANVIDVTRDVNGRDKIKRHLYSADIIVAHNSMFDRSVLNANGYRTKIDKWQDTMVQALSLSLKSSLSDLCDIFELDAAHAKDKDGKRLIQLFCKPLGKNRKLDRATRETHPEDWAKFIEYARLDVEAMRTIYHKMPDWNFKGNELALWHLDQTINDRGVCIDTELVESALSAIDREKVRLADESSRLTNGNVDSTTQRDQVLKHLLKNFGIELLDLQKSTVEALLNDGALPEQVKEILRNRQQASTSSTAKYQTLANAVNSDGRLRGTLQFNGASRTGRWSGRTFQPQNLPRPSLDNDTIEHGIDLLKLGAVDLLTDNIMELTSSAIRGCIVASQGKKLVVTDLSNIEGRVQAWLAGESWKLKAFAEYDTGTGHDLYKLAYAKSFSIKPEDVSKAQRQIGKVQELALGYQGGVGAFIAMASAYGIDLDQLAEQVYPTLPKSVIEKSTSTLAWVTENNGKPDMLPKTWIAIDGLKVMWREAHPHINALWADLDSNVRQAINNKGVTYRVGKLAIRRDGMWLRIRLPSGRYLCYPNPVIKDNTIFYKGINQYSRKWQAISSYGGKFFENICQAVARDVLASNMPLIEAAGYEIVLTVHDEVICEAPNSADFNADHLSQLLSTVPPWATGLPLSSGGFESLRYKKD